MTASNMRVLCCWDYQRLDMMRWLSRALSGFDVTYLYRKEREEVVPDGLEVRYWSEFSTPDQLLERVRPDRIVFGNIETYYDVALNIAAKARGIPTLHLEHGYRAKDEVARSYREETGRLEAFASTSHGARGWRGSLSTLAFYLAAAPHVAPAERLDYLRFLFIRSRRELTVALHAVPFEGRRPTRYVNFTRWNASYLRERDGVDDSRFVYVGNPGFDIFREQQRGPCAIEGRFVLLIDHPLEEFGITSAERSRFLETVRRFAESLDARLIVKRHPRSFGLPKPVEHENITYLEDVAAAPLVRDCVACVTFPSTLMLVAALEVPTTCIYLERTEMIDAFEESGIGRAVAFGEVRDDNLRLDPSARDSARAALFVERYVGPVDGGSFQRIHDAVAHG